MKTSKIASDLAMTSYICYGPTGWSPFLDQTSEHYDIRADLKVLRSYFNGLITYGCEGALSSIPEIAQDLGFRRMILGVYDLKNENEIESAMYLIRKFPELIRSVCLGNEGLSFKTYVLSDVQSCITRFRAEFPDLWITTSEPIFSWGSVDLVAAVDFCLPIIHPWIHQIFNNDPVIAALWTIQSAQRLQILTNKPVLIKETGFPADGIRYPNEFQTQFWLVLTRELGALSRHVYLAFFEAFDNPLKEQFSARTHWDCYWGLFDAQRNAKPVMAVLGPYLRPLTEVDFQGSEQLANSRASSEVTVVITGRNRAEYMKQAIESVWQQIEDVHEIILVNDNSIDNSVDEICRNYAFRPGVIYLHRLTGGSSGTSRNQGLEFVKTRYVCFLDDDDLFAPNKIRLQLKAFENDPDLSFVSTAANIISEDGLTTSRSGRPDFFPGAPLASMLAFCQIVHSSVMIKTEVLRDLGGYRENFPGEDWELWCRLLKSGHKTKALDLPLLSYRKHEANISDSSYLKVAVKNLLETYGSTRSSDFIRPLEYQQSSGELLRAVIFIVHGEYEKALSDLGGCGGETAKIARFICLRGLGRYPEARSELLEWAEKENLQDEIDLRLRVHEAKFRPHQAMVGSPISLVEHRLLAQDALLASTRPSHRVQLELYFHKSPQNISIERNEVAEGEDLFFKRVSLTSC